MFASFSGGGGDRPGEPKSTSSSSVAIGGGFSASIAGVDKSPREPDRYELCRDIGEPNGDGLNGGGLGVAM